MSTTTNREKKSSSRQLERDTFIQLFDDGETGLLFPVGDEEALRGCLARMNSDPELRREMGRGGREKAERLYGRDRHYESIMEVYHAVLAARRGK